MMTCAQLRITCQDFLQFGNRFAKFLQLILNLLAFQTGQALELHFENGLGLNLGELVFA